MGEAILLWDVRPMFVESLMRPDSLCLKAKQKGSYAPQGLIDYNLLFGMERGLADNTSEERYRAWQRKAKPVLDAMFACVNSRATELKPALGKDIHYLKEQWPYLAIT